MITRKFILFLLIVSPFIAHSQEKSTSKVVVKQFQFVESVEDVPSPPPDLKVKFKNVQDWLINVCTHDKPKKSITEYKVGLFESSKDYTLTLTGENKYNQGENASSARIKFTPSEMYFKLPKK